MEDYREELNAMGIKTFDKDRRLSDLYRIGQSLLKNKRNLINQKQASSGLDNLGTIHASDEGISDALLRESSKIEDSAYNAQFNEADFLQRKKLNDAQLDEMEGSLFGDILGVAAPLTGLLDVTGLGATIGNAIFGGSKRARSSY